MQLFGFNITRSSDQTRKVDKENLESFAPPQNDDGAVLVASVGANFSLVDLDGTAASDAELITRYRDLAIQPEIEMAVDEIVNEMIAYDMNEDLVKLNTDSLEGYTDKIKKRISEEFDQCLKLLDFNNSGYDIIRRWYIDGRMYYHVIIDEQSPAKGIQELRYIDPRKIRKVKEVAKKAKGQITTSKVTSEYYVYSERSFNLNANPTQTALDITSGAQVGGIKIAKDSIIYATSGLMDQWNRTVLSHLHKALRPMNQLRSVEDATIIYRLARAPERRIFYIDVGNLPKHKAEQYVMDLMARHKNKMVYNPATGTINDDRRMMHMLEDYWFPRREGGKGTEVTTLAAGQNLGEMEDVEYFRRNLFRSLNVPTSRLIPNENGFNLGRSSEITREELKFQKFIDRLRLRFGMMLKEILKRQLLLKNVVSIDEVDTILDSIKIDYNRDNQFTELKEMEIARERNNLAREMDELVGKYYSRNWIRKNILRFDDETIAAMDEEMKLDMEANLPQQYGSADSEQQFSNPSDGQISPDDTTSQFDSSKETMESQKKIKEKEEKEAVKEEAYLALLTTLTETLKNE